MTNRSASRLVLHRIAHRPNNVKLAAMLLQLTSYLVRSTISQVRVDTKESGSGVDTRADSREKLHI